MGKTSKKIRQVDSTWAEERTYDEDGKLIEIRKFGRSKTVIQANIKKTGYSGMFGGSE